MIDSIARGFEIKDPRANWKYVNWVKTGIKNGEIPKVNSLSEEKWSYFLEFWRPFRLNGSFYGSGLRYAEASSIEMIISSLLQYLILIPLFILGLVFGMQKLNKVILLLGMIVLVHCFIHVFLAHTIYRYRLPIDPYLILIAMFGLHGIRERLQKTSN
jgi:hypothetical protein